MAIDTSKTELLKLITHRFVQNCRGIYSTAVSKRSENLINNDVKEKQNLLPYWKEKAHARFFRVESNSLLKITVVTIDADVSSGVILEIEGYERALFYYKKIYKGHL